MNALVARHLPSIRDVCRRYPIQRLTLIGSARHPSPGTSFNDVDVVVYYQPGVTGAERCRTLLNFPEELEAVLGCPVEIGRAHV